MTNSDKGLQRVYELRPSTSSTEADITKAISREPDEPKQGPLVEESWGEGLNELRRRPGAVSHLAPFLKKTDLIPLCMLEEHVVLGG